MHTRHLFLATLFFCPCLWAQTPESTPNEPAAPQTLEQANALRERAKQMEKEADALYESDQTACYQKFLVNSCLDDAKKRHTQSRLEARKLDAAGRDFQRAAKRADAEAKETKRAADLQARVAEQKAQGEAYRDEEAARAAARQEKLAKKARQAEEGRRKTAEEQAKRQAKEEKRAKKDAERAAKKAQDAEKSAAKTSGAAN